jgi:hypothetical protein
VTIARPSKVPKPLQPTLATLIDISFVSKDWCGRPSGTAFGRQRKKSRSAWLYLPRGIFSYNNLSIDMPLEKVEKGAVIDGAR